MNIKDKLEKVENIKIRENIKWAIQKINENNTKNIIVFSRNASGKTTLSNILSTNKMHYHDEYVRFDTESKNPSAIIGDRVRKFTYNEKMIHKNILNGSPEFNNFFKEVKKYLINYKGAASILEYKFIDSLNNDLIHESLENYNIELAKRIEKEEYYNENYYLRPYIYINSEMKINSQIINIADGVFYNEEVYNNFKGDGLYINELLKNAISNESKNGIYAIIIMCLIYFYEIKNLKSSGIGLFVNGNYNSISNVNLSENQLEKISKNLKNFNIMNEKSSLSYDDFGRIMFKENQKNITMNIFNKMSKGQNDLVSMTFFNEINKDESEIIIDDPFDSLDMQNSYEMVKLIKKRENNKRTIILFHSTSHFKLLKQYLSNDSNWITLYMSNRELLSLSDMTENVLRKFKYVYINNKNYKTGIFLLIRFFGGGSSLNKYIYKEINRHFAFSAIKEYIKFEELEPSNIPFYEKVLSLFDKLVEIKKWFKNLNNSNDLKNQFKMGVYNEDNQTLIKYSKIYFIINDLSHNNKWSLDVFDILSYENEIDDLYKDILKYQNKDN